MYELEYSTQFKKDFKKVNKMSIPDIVEVGNIISKLQRGETLDAINVDHSLTGNWVGFRDPHKARPITHLPNFRRTTPTGKDWLA